MIGWLIFGALIGWIASMIMKKDAQMGAIANIVVGILGAMFGGWIGNTLLGTGDVYKFTIQGTIISIIGACILLAIVNAITGRK